MTGPRRMHRRGALLLEVILSLTIFVFVGLAAISLASHALNSVRRAADTRNAIDIARTVMSRIEIGLVAPEAATGPVAAWQPTLSADGDRSAAVPGWAVRVETQAGPLAELTLVTVHVMRETSPGASEPDQVYSLRQFVRLGELRQARGISGTGP